MDSAAITEYDRTRDFSNKAVRAMCYAPYANLYFDQWGKAKVCCWSGNYPVGDVRSDSIDEIWQGTRLRLLRESMEAYTFDRGCAFCQRQVDAGWLESTVMRKFDQYTVDVRVPQWPK